MATNWKEIAGNLYDAVREAARLLNMHSVYVPPSSKMLIDNAYNSFAEAAKQPAESTLSGDTPCWDCGTEQNIVWFTDNVFWNAVCPDESPILCLPCFIKRTEAAGYRPVAWRVLPEWGWQ